MQTGPIPQNLVAVHDLLTEVIDSANTAGGNFGYGVALFQRAGRFATPVFGVVTRGGESTTLTYRLLQTLAAETVYVSGRIAAGVRHGTGSTSVRTPPPALLDQPVLLLSLTLTIGSAPDGLERTMPLESTVFAGELTAPIILLLGRRPAGWPR